MPGLMRDESTRPTPLAIRWQHELGDYVVAVAVSGDRVFVGTGDGQLRCLDAESGAVCWQHQAHDNGVLALSVSADGQMLATSGPGPAVKLWRRTGEATATVTLPGKAWVEHVVWSPTKPIFATGAGREVRLHDEAGAVTTTLPALQTTVAALIFRSDGGAVAAACYGGVSIWPLTPQKFGTSRQLPWKGSLVSLVFSPDGRVIAGGTQDQAVHFWRLASGEDSEMSGFNSKPKAVAFDDASRWLATAGGVMITLWSFRGRGPEGTAPIELFGHRDLCSKVAFQPGHERLASGGLDGLVLTWTPATSLTPQGVGMLGTEVTALSWCNDGVIAGDGAGRLMCWRL